MLNKIKTESSPNPNLQRWMFERGFDPGTSRGKVFV